MLHEEVDAVFLERDGEGCRVVDALQNFEGLDVDLEAGGCAGVGANFAGDDDAGFLCEAFECFEDFRGDAFYVGNALDGAGAVAKDGEEELAALTEVVEPTAQGDGLAFVLADGSDVGHGRWHLRCSRRGLRGRSGWVFGHSVPRQALRAGQIRIAREGAPGLSRAGTGSGVVSGYLSRTLI